MKTENLQTKSIFNLFIFKNKLFQTNSLINFEKNKNKNFKAFKSFLHFKNHFHWKLFRHCWKIHVLIKLWIKKLSRWTNTKKKKKSMSLEKSFPFAISTSVLACGWEVCVVKTNYYSLLSYHNEKALRSFKLLKKVLMAVKTFPPEKQKPQVILESLMQGNIFISYLFYVITFGFSKYDMSEKGKEAERRLKTITLLLLLLKASWRKKKNI